jgi:sec-independent protein translocase protein TatA
MSACASPARSISPACALPCTGRVTALTERLCVFDISPVHLILLLAIALVVFGPKRLPEMARNLGRGVREFKSAIAVDEHAPHAAPAAQAPAETATLSTAAAHDPALEGFVRSGEDQPARPSE